MAFAGMNYIAVFVAALAGLGVGAVWYGVFGKASLDALGKSEDDIKGSGAAQALPFVTGLVADLVMAIMLTTGCLSAFMSNIGVAALMLPVVIDVARKSKTSPSRLLMPMAFASLAAMRERNGSYSLWWTDGSDLVAPSLLVCPGLPDEHGYAGMLDGQWRQWSWHVLCDLASQGGEIVESME